MALGDDFGGGKEGDGERFDGAGRGDGEWEDDGVNGGARLKVLIEPFHGANGGRSAEAAETVIAEMFEGLEERRHGEAGEIETEEVEAPFGAAQGLAGREAGAEDEGARGVLTEAAGSAGDFFGG